MWLVKSSKHHVMSWFDWWKFKPPFTFRVWKTQLSDARVSGGPVRIVKEASVKIPRVPVAQSIAQRRDVMSFSGQLTHLLWVNNGDRIKRTCPIIAVKRSYKLPFPRDLLQPPICLCLAFDWLGTPTASYLRQLTVLWFKNTSGRTDSFFFFPFFVLV